MSLIGRALRLAGERRGVEYGAGIVSVGSALMTDAGAVVSRDTALTVTAVYCAVDIIAGAVSTLPVDVLQGYPDGSRYPRPRPRWLVEPYPGVDWPTFCAALMVSLLIDGNAFIAVSWESGQPSLLRLLDPAAVAIEVASDGLPRYHVATAAGTVDVPRSDMLHVRGLTLPGRWRGLAPIELARESLGRTLAAGEFASTYLKNFAAPGPVITHPRPLPTEAKRAAAEAFQRRHAGAHRFLPVVLDNGADVKTLSLTPDQVQLIEVMRLGIEDVARLYHLPLHLLAEHEKSTSWGSGIAEQNIMFATYTLRPWTVRLETALTALLRRALADDTWYVRLDMRGLLRGSPQQQAEYLARKAEHGALTPNEWRRLDDENPLPGMDSPLLAANILPASQPAARSARYGSEPGQQGMPPEKQAAPAEEKVDIRRQAIAATPRHELVLELMAGLGAMTEIYREAGFRRIVRVDSDSSWDDLDVVKTAVRFIREDLDRYLDVDLVDIDDEGCPGVEVQALLERLAELGRSRPFTLVLTDGMALKLKFRDGAVDLDKFWLLGRSSRPSDYDRYERIHADGVRRVARHYGWEAEDIALVRYGGGTMVASAWRLRRAQ